MMEKRGRVAPQLARGPEAKNSKTSDQRGERGGSDAVIRWRQQGGISEHCHR